MLVKSIFRRRLLVAVAITLMICSAVVNYFLVHQNDKRIVMLKQEQQQIDETIRNLWDNAGRMERNADAAVIVSLLARNDPAEAEELKHYYISRSIELQGPAGSLIKTLKAVDSERERTIDLINDTYIRRTVVENDSMTLEQNNTLYANIAFFLQVIGLVLVVLTREMPDA